MASAARAGFPAAARLAALGRAFGQKLALFLSVPVRFELTRPPNGALLPDLFGGPFSLGGALTGLLALLFAGAVDIKIDQIGRRAALGLRVNGFPRRRVGAFVDLGLGRAGQQQGDGEG